jgi:hypothetical protein
MLIELLKELAVALARALVVESLCERVQSALVTCREKCKERRRGRTYRAPRVRYRESVLHRLATDEEQ